MNRSYSKIRHIKESNTLLEFRKIKLLNESEELKNFLKRRFGLDLTDNIEEVTYYPHLPEEFKKLVRPSIFDVFMERFGPSYVFNHNGTLYFYQEQKDTPHGHFIIKDGKDGKGWIEYEEFLNDLGIPPLLGFSIQDVIETYL